jgi:hypothetical protein
MAQAFTFTLWYQGLSVGGTCMHSKAILLHNFARWLTNPNFFFIQVPEVGTDGEAIQF